VVFDSSVYRNALLLLVVAAVGIWIFVAFNMMIVCIARRERPQAIKWALRWGGTVGGLIVIGMGVGLYIMNSFNSKTQQIFGEVENAPFPVQPVVPGKVTQKDTQEPRATSGRA